MSLLQDPDTMAYMQGGPPLHTKTNNSSPQKMNQSSLTFNPNQSLFNTMMKPPLAPGFYQKSTNQSIYSK